MVVKNFGGIKKRSKCLRTNLKYSNFFGDIVKLASITRETIKRAPDKELLNLHLRCHQLWSLSMKGKNYDTKQIKEKHSIIVFEMRQRGFKHHYINSLDDNTITEKYELLSNILLEGVPENPQTVLLRNKFYPNGLTEDMAYNYYMSVKNDILSYIGNRTVSFFLMIDGNIVVKRNHKGQRIILNKRNYDVLVTGRTLCIHINRFSNTTNYFVVDIDIGEELNLSKIVRPLETAQKLIEGDEKLKNEIKGKEVLFTGKGIHYIVYLKRKYNIDDLRKYISGILSVQKDYDIASTRKVQSNQVIYDMSSNFTNSMHISKFSLAKNGLKVLNLKSLNAKSYVI